jgi:uncharacterized protein
MSFFATVTGLCFALGGPALIASYGNKLFDNSESPIAKILQQIVLAICCLVVMGVVIFWERQPLSSIGLHPLRWQSILWGFTFAGFLIFIYSPIIIWAMAKLSHTGFASGLAQLETLPIWYLVLAVAIGGVVEEVLYRGYAAERLSWLTGGYWIGCGLSLIAFGLAHVPLWGWIPAFTTVLSGGLLTLFYLGTGDLLTAIVAHIVTDGAGIIVPKITHSK